MDVVTAGNTIRDNLRTNLTDPIATAGGTARPGSMWIFFQEPIVAAKQPQIKIKKIDNPTEVLTIGDNYWEREQIFFRILFTSKNGFKVTVGGTEYVNESLVEYYLNIIKTTLKDQFNTLFAAGVKDYKHVSTGAIDYDANTQLYFGTLVIRVEFFTQ